LLTTFFRSALSTSSVQKITKKQGIEQAATVEALGKKLELKVLKKDEYD